MCWQAEHKRKRLSKSQSGSGRSDDIYMAPSGDWTQRMCRETNDDDHVMKYTWPAHSFDLPFYWSFKRNVEVIYINTMFMSSFYLLLKIKSVSTMTSDCCPATFYYRYNSNTFTTITSSNFNRSIQTDTFFSYFLFALIVLINALFMLCLWFYLLL